MSYDSAFIASQCIAALAFVAGLIGFQSKELRSILTWFAVCSFLSAIHFALLGAWTAGAVIAVSGMRHVVARYKRSMFAMYFFLMMVVILTYFTYEKPVNLLASFSAILGTLGSFAENAAKARKIWMVSSSTYIIHNVLVHTPVAAIMETFFLFSNIIAYKRHYSRKVSPETTSI